MVVVAIVMKFFLGCATSLQFKDPWVLQESIVAPVEAVVHMFHQLQCRRELPLRQLLCLREPPLHLGQLSLLHVSTRQVLWIDTAGNVTRTNSTAPSAKVPILSRVIWVLLRSIAVRVEAEMSHLNPARPQPFPIPQLSLQLLPHLLLFQR